MSSLAFSAFLLSASLSPTSNLMPVSEHVATIHPQIESYQQARTLFVAAGGQDYKEERRQLRALFAKAFSVSPEETLQFAQSYNVSLQNPIVQKEADARIKEWVKKLELNKLSSEEATSESLTDYQAAYTHFYETWSTFISSSEFENFIKTKAELREAMKPCMVSLLQDVDTKDHQKVIEALQPLTSTIDDEDINFLIINEWSWKI